MSTRPTRGDDSRRYWQIRVILEFIKLGVWVGWKWFRDGAL